MQEKKNHGIEFQSNQDKKLSVNQQANHQTSRYTSQLVECYHAIICFHHRSQAGALETDQYIFHGNFYAWLSNPMECKIHCADEYPRPWQRVDEYFVPVWNTRKANLSTRFSLFLGPLILSPFLLHLHHLLPLFLTKILHDSISCTFTDRHQTSQLSALFATSDLSIPVTSKPN